MSLIVKLSVLLISTVVTVTLFVSMGFAQQPAYPELSGGADLSSAFNRSHTYIGIPAGHVVYTYAPPSDTADTWRLIDSALIPSGTVGIDGNIRKLYFLQEDRIIYKEYSYSDTLVFDDEFVAIKPELWVRNPYSTEKDVYFMEKGKQFCYYSDGSEWYISDEMNPRLFRENKTDPPLDEKQPFSKLYSFAHGDALYISAVYSGKVCFHRHEMLLDSLNERIVEPELLTFAFPEEAISVFVYDRSYLGVVLPGRISFYQFDPEQAKWVAYSRLKPFILD